MTLKPTYFIDCKPNRLFKYHLYRIHYLFGCAIWYSRVQRSDVEGNIKEHMYDYIHGRNCTQRWYDAAGSLMHQSK